MLYILGAIAVIAGGIYFFMRREPKAQTAADIARAQSQEPISEPQPEPEQPVQEETSNEPNQPTQEESQTENNQVENQSENTDQSSSDDEDKNR